VQPNRTIRTRPTLKLVDIRRVSSGSPLEGQIGFSRAVRVGNFIAVAGTAPIPGDSGRVDTWSVYEQTRLCLQIVRKAIEEAGGRLDDVIRTRIMLTDISAWREAAQAHGEYFSNLKPVCTFIEVSGFIDPAWKVEVEADCLVG
jgi:enamine deaminase RidA (YjgF/YER057c/UK114 family)